MLIPAHAPAQVVSRLEAILARKPFNQLGGLQLDRDTRLMVRGGGGVTLAWCACVCMCVGGAVT